MRSMRYSLGLVVSTLAYLELERVRCTDVVNDEVRISNGAIASGCDATSNRRTCKFDTASLKLDVGTAIQFVIDTGGRTITCRKIFNKGTQRWYGSCDGDADDANFITRADRNGTERVFGSIRVGSDVCQIGPNILGEDEIRCIPQSDFKVEKEPMMAMNTENRRMYTERDTSSVFGFVSAYNQSESHNALRGRYHHDEEDADRVLFDDSGGNIDIMVVWTKAAECFHSGATSISKCVLTETTENMMRGLIDLAIFETNTAYNLSGMFAQLRLVHAYRDPDYVEIGNMETYVTHLTDRNDGYLESVHAKRTLYGADVVQMIAGTGMSFYLFIGASHYSF
jgi:hypothetical protein